MISQWRLWEGLVAIAFTLGSGLPQSCTDLPESAISPQPSPTATVQADATAVDAPAGPMEQAIFDQVNAHRQTQDLAPLAYRAAIATSAHQHSDAMAQQGSLSHDGFEQRVAAIAQTIPYRSAGENVANNQGFPDPASQAVIGWLNSPGHRANIEGDFNLTGIGMVQTADGTYYFTQIFIRSR